MVDDPDDRDLFRKKMADVRRLSTDREPVPRPRPRPKARFAREEKQQVLHESLNSDSDSHEEVAYSRPGVAPFVLRKLKRGKYSVENELDLHGLNVAMAKNALDEFIQECRYLDQHCVRIVHGKGKRSGKA
ncbi:MAG: Smr/MutS family protein, partial [Gammaproteobacteria bacterium]|nr:Smr/MutS family protein [Gammaproteobacteria bacterium]